MSATTSGLITAGVARHGRQREDGELSSSFQKALNKLKQPSARWSLAALLLSGSGLGVVATVSFNFMIHETSSDQFCNVCHSTNIEPDYAGTVHSTNHIGVRVNCHDCHIPKEFVPKLYRKATAGARDVFHTIIGTINTPEKFEAHRMTMATAVWDSMRANDSRACRYCHDDTGWDLSAQTPNARDYHVGPLAKGKTCIDCHKGLAHPLPQGIEPDSQVDRHTPSAPDTAMQTGTAEPGA
jgi:cytochrome c-type protein NapC